MIVYGSATICNKSQNQYFAAVAIKKKVNIEVVASILEGFIKYRTLELGKILHL